MEQTKITVTFEQTINFRVVALDLQKAQGDKFSVFLNCIRHALRNTEEAYEGFADQESELLLKYVAKDDKGFGIFSEKGSAQMSTENQRKFNKERQKLLKTECQVLPYRYTESKVPYGVTAANIDFFTPFIFTEEQVEAWMNTPETEK